MSINIRKINLDKDDRIGLTKKTVFVFIPSYAI